VDQHHLAAALWQAQSMSDLPPLDQPQAYVVVGPNDQRGPYTMELLISEVVAGRLSDATPVWWPALTDWTTLAAHPAVAAEISRRRAAAAPAPAWATPAAEAPAQPEPAPAPAPVPEAAAPASTPYEPAAAAYEPATVAYEPAPQPAAASPFAAPQPVTPAPVEASAVVNEAVVAEAVLDDPSEPVDAEVVEIIEVTELTDDQGTVVAEVVEVVELDPEVLAHFAALVGRSGRRADAQARVDSVDEALVSAVIDAATAKGFGLDDRVDIERGHELRFGEAGGDLLVISLGRIGSTRPEEIRSDHVPITVSYRSGSYEGQVEPGDGAHGDVVITADEWTGQATSSVTLFLGLEDYVDDSLVLDQAAVARDIGAVVSVVHDRLS
jgi:hypothetical protein